MYDNKFWRRYEKGRDYLDTKNLVNRMNTCWNFFVGKQWEGVEADGEELPFLNVCLKDLAVKPGILIAGIIRERKPMIPSGNDFIQAGDRVVVIAANQRLQDLAEIV